MVEANDIRSEIGFAVEMAVKGWKRDRSGRGFWRREVKRLVNDPEEYFCRATSYLCACGDVAQAVKTVQGWIIECINVLEYPDCGTHTANNHYFIGQAESAWRQLDGKFGEPHPAEPAPKVRVCPFCIIEINGASCNLCPKILV